MYLLGELLEPLPVAVGKRVVHDDEALEVLEAVAQRGHLADEVIDAAAAEVGPAAALRRAELQQYVQLWGQPRLDRTYCRVRPPARPRRRDQALQRAGPRYQARPGGYLRILKFGFRQGDAAPMALVELVGRPEAGPVAEDGAKAE